MLSHVFRLILTTVLITAKFYNDIFFANQYIASVGGVTLQNLNELEEFFVEVIDWQLFISPEEFHCYENVLRQQIDEAQAVAVNAAMQSPTFSRPSSHINSPVALSFSPSPVLSDHQAQLHAALTQQVNQHATQQPYVSYQHQQAAAAQN